LHIDPSRVARHENVRDENARGATGYWEAVDFGSQYATDPLAFPVGFA
jgi:hypothetical protein